MIKKQDQRLSDLKKLMQRELKMTPPPGDDDQPVAQSAASQTSVSCRSLVHARNGSSVSVDLVLAGVHAPAETTLSVSQSGASLSDVRSGGSSVSVDMASDAAVHNCSTSPADLQSPATLSISDQHTVNGQFTPTNCDLARSLRGQRSSAGDQRSHAGIVMSPADCEYDFVRELNFKYLRHVVLKFMLSREPEVKLFS